MTLNRTQQPPFKQVEQINFVEARPHQLQNGIPVYVINAGEQNLVRLEFIFENSNWDAHKPLLAGLTNAMLSEGTHALSSAEIASKIDYYGAFFQAEATPDHSILTLYSLNKYLPQTLPVIKEMLSGSIFPQKELDVQLRNQKQKLKLALEKNAVLARRDFANALFGDTPYGITATQEDYDKVLRDDLIAHYQAVYQPNNCVIVASGKILDETIVLLNELFGQLKSTGEQVSPDYTPHSAQERLHYTEKPEALQSAIRIGTIAMQRKHPDFVGMQVLNTALGGYFGSRLMSNIREDKGYTYGIGSGLASLQHGAYFFIATEVGVDVTAATLREIEFEVERLKNELIAPQELDLIRNFMVGSLLGSLENAFSHADKFKNLHFSGLDYSYYQHYVNTVKTIQAHELQALAQRYFDYNNFHKVVVGKM
ncbi:peptidase M16 [Pelobium manganitolerans]|uniref:Peptidase M16 n=1 Tax=Pelobium manganitolerans TaxID=1842495 RepID=A0A419S5K7_9SPHI|nr:pitrilysin family protein [Pelobium manganitolerans]RKD16134.1 peptidase M16 [Pelobium manganitolerans]